MTRRRRAAPAEATGGRAGVVLDSERVCPCLLRVGRASHLKTKRGGVAASASARGYVAAALRCRG